MTDPGARLPQVVVVGGGVIGISCAYYLALRGAGVTVLERAEIGAGASSGNAGTIAVGHGPINKPGRVTQAVRSLLDPLSPLYIAPRWDPALLRWLLAFSRHCSAAHLEHCLRVLAPLSHATPGLFAALVRDERLDCAYRADGYYEAFLTQGGFERARHESEAQRRHGFGVEVLDGAALRERLPALKPDVLGGVFFPESATVNPQLFLLELTDRARRRGAVIRGGAPVAAIAAERSRVTGVVIEDGGLVPADAVILATGAYSSTLLTRLGYRLPLQPAKGYHRDVEAARAQPALNATCMLGETSVFCTPMGGFLRLAGTLEFSGLNHEIRQGRLRQLARAAGRYLHVAFDAPAQSEWCGLRPCLPDGLPVIGPASRHAGLYVATGHAILGLTLGPVTGQLMAACVLDGKPSIDLHPFRLNRL